MSTLSLRLPDSLHQAVKDLAERENASINQVISTALAEKVSALLTEDFFNERSGRGSKNKFVKALKSVPSTAPDKGDELIKK
jgi:predicted transcriptional regulator